MMPWSVHRQAFHWFATSEALDEFHRVLRPGGKLGLVETCAMNRVDWVARAHAIITPCGAMPAPVAKGDWRKPFPHPASVH